ncbi:uncharacterized protein LOC136087861 [Hydra vulgaris]|uniref:Uncharacterized protein LOC136087861 n=1 Tax=Hydra vulgaris TaxID=6087 RepID=A0ABM4CZY8_HYDVU
MEEICLEHPEVKEKLKIRKKPGRPPLEVDQPLLLKAIMDIALHGSFADERRRSEVLWSIENFDKLTSEMNKIGFAISKSALYTRLLPRSYGTLEGKRHVKTVPVRLISPQNESYLKHVDGLFCSSIKYVEEVCSILGPDEVCFINQDDKVRVLIGITAAKKQAPLLMHLGYRVTLPDHDWVVAAKHKLIPSVYAGITIKKDGLGKTDAVTYSGPTYIAVRLGKHASSTAFAHGLDFQRLLDIKEFDSITRDPQTNMINPIVVFSVDGGPDENPRYQKVIEIGIRHFLKNNLDALFIMTNSPGSSAFNRAERQMAPLSKDLSGVILPHEHYGTHLGSQGNYIDKS